ncbi:MAG TPA: SPFH domain-containing protein [Candidatus Saccharimonadales bacterium]|nr:SPFH domain-containing protein [Candidatus Saccharimonadales bacterium]
MGFLPELLSTILVPVLGALVSVAKGIKFVPEGQRGIKLRFGKAVRHKTGPLKGQPKVIEPGLRLLIPFVDTLVRRHVRQQTIRSEDQEIMLKDRSVFRISAVTIFRVTDVYRALFEIDDLDDSVDDFCMAVLRDFLSVKDADGIADTQQISKELLQLLVAKAEEWGVEFISFRLTDCSPTSQTAELLLTKTLASRKMEALNAAAKEAGTTLNDLDPTLAAAIIGVPVAASIGARRGRRRTVDATGKVISSDEYDEFDD